MKASTGKPKPPPAEERLVLRARWKGIAGARKGAVFGLVGAFSAVLMLLVYGIATSGRAPVTATATEIAPVGTGSGGEWISQIPDTPPKEMAPPPQEVQSKQKTDQEKLPPRNPNDEPPPQFPANGTGAGVNPNRPPPLTPEEQYRLEEERRKREALQAARVAPPVGNNRGGNARVGREQTGTDPSRLVPSGVQGAGFQGIGESHVTEDEAQNKQAEKAAFLKAGEARTPGYLDAARTAPLGQYEVKAGSIIPAIMISGINSDLPGAVVAQVRETIYDYVSARHVLIPQGSRLVGRYDSQIAYGQERALVVWERILFPDGSSLALKGMPGTDSIGQAGAEDQVDNHYGKLFVGVVLSSILSVGAQVAAGGSNVNNSDPSVAQLAVEGVAGNANQVGQQITRKNLNVQPTLVIRPGYLFNVLVSRDLVLPIYASGKQ
jgi:type IV secretion system protein VirB10